MGIEMKREMENAEGKNPKSSFFKKRGTFQSEYQAPVVTCQRGNLSTRSTGQVRDKQLE